ncbi:MAG TPA: hypothetical protein VGH79_02515 [Gaiellaceae bacterium]|jgi:ribosomal protein S27AE
MRAPVHKSCGFDDHVLVHCPKCDECATIDAYHEVVRLTCSACGYGQRKPREGDPARFWTADLTNWGRGYPDFGARLWLETRCCGDKTLWALNRRHLDYLEAFVTSTQRRRDFPRTPKGEPVTVAERLPAWMIKAEHRDEVLKGLERLRARI